MQTLMMPAIGVPPEVTSEERVASVVVEETTRQRLLRHHRGVTDNTISGDKIMNINASSIDQRPTRRCRVTY